MGRVAERSLETVTPNIFASVDFGVEGVFGPPAADSCYASERKSGCALGKFVRHNRGFRFLIEVLWVNVIFGRGGSDVPLALIAIRTPLPRFANDEDRKAVCAKMHRFGLLCRERFYIDR